MTEKKKDKVIPNFVNLYCFAYSILNKHSPNLYRVQQM